MSASRPFPEIALLAATSLEARALRRELPDADIVTAGIALSKGFSWRDRAVVSCGLAGGLRPDLPTGTLLLPRQVRRSDGRILDCDPDLIDAFAHAARALHIEPVFDPLLTADAIVRGPERAVWAARGFAGVDMETGRIDAPRVAAVRVILDTPQRELSQDWLHPIRAMFKPWNWPQLIWLAREAPRAAHRAACVVAQGIASDLRITSR
jgi:hypothetical protein